jgi:hypothetical protein
MPLLTDPSTWGSAVAGPVLKTQLVDPINEWTADTGYLTSGIFAGGTGVTIGSQIGRVIGNVAWVRVNYTVGPTFPGVPITPSASGDLSNVVVATIIDSRFLSAAAFADQSLTTSSVGRLAAHALRTATDDVVLAAVAGTANIANGDQFTFSGAYLLD